MSTGENDKAGAGKLTSYTVHGYAVIAERKSALRYAGEYGLDRVYLLGNGFRAYSPTLMRFFSSDAYSPFESGGVNAYAYCSGDPISFSDSSGRARYRIAHVPKAKKVEPSLGRPGDNVQPPTIQQDRLPAINEQPTPHLDPARPRGRDTKINPADPTARYRENTGLREDSIDPRKNTRGQATITASEAEVLHDFNKVSTRTFSYLGVNKSRLARFIVIEEKLSGGNPYESLRKAFPNMPNRGIERIANTIGRQLAQIRSGR
ncbi:RHS repeat-associated core domain-containing protein [Pseudomonas sp. MLB6B]